MNIDPQLPIALLCMHQFRGAEATLFPLYRGVNSVGLQPEWTHIFLPWAYIVRGIQFQIRITHDGFVFCRDPYFSNTTLFGRVIAKYWHQVLPGNICGIANNIFFHVEMLEGDARREWPRRTRWPVPRDIVEARLEMAARVAMDIRSQVDLTTVNIARLR